MRPILLTAAIALAACTPQPGNESPENSAVNVDAIDSDEDVGVAKPTPAPLAPPEPGTPGGLANDMTPVSEAPFGPDSAQGAADVVQHYFADIESGRYAQAWALWEDGGNASDMTAKQFAASFARYSEYHANIGAPGDIDAGAGQRYVTVPVVAWGRRATGGARFDLKGSVTLHRTVVDGASDAQKRWHIRSVDLGPVR